MSLIVTTFDKQMHMQAIAVAMELGLPYDLQPSSSTNLWLVVSNFGIGITDNLKHSPIIVDFSSNKLKYRLKNNRSEHIIKASGINKLKNPVIYDLTAGLGQDSFMLASTGNQVHMYERSKIIWYLLNDGLKRAKSDLTICKIINNMSLQFGNAIDFLNQIDADIIYMDPMFPSKVKTAAIRKEMKFFKRIVGDDLDTEELFLASLKIAKYRLVVKRPLKSPYLADRPPSFRVDGQSSRFDVYQI